MREKRNDMNIDGARRPRGLSRGAWGIAAVLLLLPAVAMRFDGSGVDWTGSDFAIAALLLGATCGAWEVARRITRRGLPRAAVAVAVLAGFFQVWVNLAVGLVGEGSNPANLMFMGVPVVAIAGALAARFRPAGMARAMLAAAVVHLLVGAAAAIAGWGLPDDDALHVAGVTLFFAAPWLVSAALFRAATGDVHPAT